MTYVPNEYCLQAYSLQWICVGSVPRAMSTTVEANVHIMIEFFYSCVITA